VLYNKVNRTIGDNQVVVPDAFFKVVLCLNGAPKGIAFICKNEGENLKTADYVTTISRVEQIIGIEFFPSLPNGIVDIVKKKADINKW
jgi:endonuclease G